MMQILKVTANEFTQQVEHSEKPVILDFWAPWCTYCRGLEPVFDRLAQQETDRFAFGKVNIDEEMALAERFEIMTIPTLLLFRGGEAGPRLVAPGSQETIEDWLREQGAI